MDPLQIADVDATNDGSSCDPSWEGRLVRTRLRASVCYAGPCGKTEDDCAASGVEVVGSENVSRSHGRADVCGVRVVRLSNCDEMPARPKPSRAVQNKGDSWEF